MEDIIRWLFGFEFKLLGFTVNIGNLSKSVVDILKVNLQNMSSGDLWNIAERIHSAILPIAYSLLAIFLMMELINVCLEIDRFDWKRVIMTMIKFLIVKSLVRGSMLFVQWIMETTSDLFFKVYNSISSTNVGQATLVDSVVKLCDTGSIITDVLMFLVILIFWIVYIAIVVAVISNVFVRIFKVVMMGSFSGLAISSLTNEHTSQAGKSFFKNFIALGLETSLMYLSCIFYNYILSHLSSSGDIGNLVGLIVANSIFLMLIQIVNSMAKELTGGA